MKTLLSILALLTSMSCFADPPAISNPILPSLDLNVWTCTGSCGSIGASGDIPLAPFAGHSQQYGFVSTLNDFSDPLVQNIGPIVLDVDTPNTNGSKFVSPTFEVTTPRTFSAHFNYITTDGSGYADYSWARLVNAAGESTYLFLASAASRGKRDVIPGGVLSSFKPIDTIVDYSNWHFNQIADGLSPTWGPLGETYGCWKNGGTCGNTGWVEARVLLNPGTYSFEAGVTNVLDGAYDSGLAFDLGGMTPVVPSVPESPQYALFAVGLILVIRQLTKSKQV